MSDPSTKSQRKRKRKPRTLPPLPTPQEAFRLLVERFLLKLDRTTVPTCWLWTGTRQNQVRDNAPGLGQPRDPNSKKLMKMIAALPSNDRLGRAIMMDPRYSTPKTRGRGGKTVHTSAERIAWDIFYGVEVPEGQRPVASCGTPGCLRHLKLASRRSARAGADHPKAQLNGEIAANLRRFYTPRSRRMSLGRLKEYWARRGYDLSREAIRLIVHGESSGGSKAPPKVAKKIRSMYEPPASLDDFVPKNTMVAKSTLAAAAAGKTWTPDEPVAGVAS